MFERLKQSVLASYVGATALGWLLVSPKSSAFREHFHCTSCRLILPRISRIHRTYNSPARLLAPRCSDRVT